MPYAPPRACACGAIVQAGTYCACQIRRRAENDRRRPNATERGYDSKWQRERVAFLKAHPNCTFCGTAATVVDHKTPHRGDKRLFWSRSNWQPLCAPCHNSRKQRMERSRQ
jgi:5-methylcytosine-specific restriction enzyme A